tara:strand:+ start:101 stop:328 length:228 start_codon:yes stop_codon:yes gene_type:complete
MELDELIEIALNNRVLKEDIAAEILQFGISEFLKAGVSYDRALDIIENARVSYGKAIFQKQLDPRVGIEEEGDAP